MLAELAVNDAKGFADLVAVAKEGLANPKAKEVVETVFVKPAPKAERTANHAAHVAAVKKAETVETVKEEKVEAPKAEPKKVAKKAATPDYESMTLADLKALCKEKGVKGYSTLKKAEIIELLTK